MHGRRADYIGRASQSTDARRNTAATVTDSIHKNPDHL